MKIQRSKQFGFDCLIEPIIASISMLNPRIQVRNPLVFITYVGAIVVTYYILIHSFKRDDLFFNLQMAFGLWMTVLLSNFAEALAKCRSKAYANSLRSNQSELRARLITNGKEVSIFAKQLCKGDIILCKKGEIVPADGEVIEGVATVDESAITGESASVIREPGSDWSAVTAGTTILSDQLKIRVLSEPGKTFFDQMLRFSEGGNRQKTPSELSTNTLLSVLTIVILLGMVILVFFEEKYNFQLLEFLTPPLLIGLFICLIPVLASALINVLSVVEMERVIKSNVIVQNERSVELATKLNVILFDKTGTLTIGNRIATAFIPFGDVLEAELVNNSLQASLLDKTFEGKSIVSFATNHYDLKIENFDLTAMVAVPFSLYTRMSGVNIKDVHGKVERQIRKGSPDVIKKHVEGHGGIYSSSLDKLVQEVGAKGSTPLVVCENSRVLGIIVLKDQLKNGLQEAMEKLRKLRIRTILITADNIHLAAAMAAEIGVDDFIAESSPAEKLALVKKEQLKSHVVGMVGDGSADAPSIAQADVGMAMNSGSQVSLEAANMIDLENNPTKILDIIMIAKQTLLMRRILAITSVLSGLVKLCFLALFWIGSTNFLGGMAAAGFIHPHSLQSAILSALIFNVLVIGIFIPIVFRGFVAKDVIKSNFPTINLIVYGVGVIVISLCSLKLIETALVSVGAA